MYISLTRYADISGIFLLDHEWDTRFGDCGDLETTHVVIREVVLLGYNYSASSLPLEFLVPVNNQVEANGQ